MKYNLIHSDCLSALKAMPENSIDSIVTDPPYGISFMGKKWDYDVPSVEIWRECLRVLKPGGHALIACGTRTQHRMVVNIEDAGFEIRDVVTWLYGSGFPKSHNIKEGKFKGWGTALKPACEFWTLARKPLIGTVTENVQEHGTGALNIDGCRVGETRPATINDPSKFKKFKEQDGTNRQPSCVPDLNINQGRWPANLILDEVTADILDQQSGERRSGGSMHERSLKEDHALFRGFSPGRGVSRLADTGGASRFFYVAKASKSERNAGCEQFEGKGRTCYDPKYHEGGGKLPAAKGNNHPTVKPVKLMSYLCRLITPPSGTVLDPFMGSGSTGVAAIQEGFKFVGIEREAEYVEIARARISTNDL